MKAAIVERYGSVVVRDIPDPRPGDYEALCELLYGATCSGTDNHLLAGHRPFSDWVKLPFIIGHESVGRVVKVGPKVRNFRIGDLVTRVGAPGGDGVNVGWGGFAEMGIAKDHWAMAAAGRPQSEWDGHRVNQIVPAAVDPREAPMFTTWRETLSAIQRAGVSAGASVLVVGSGGNGLSFAAHAVNLKASFVAVVGSARLEKAAMGKARISAYLDYRSDDVADRLRGMQPDGFDFIIDAVGKAGVADRFLPCIEAGGRYLTYGMDEAAQIRMDRGRARGDFTVMPCSYDEAETHQQVSEFFLRGQLDTTLWYDPSAPYPLDHIADALADVKARTSVKALVRLSRAG